ncbi:MAG: hypothetical protein HKN19_07085 [Halioglobus sp.]|nr:hypothetical protein [Halioglobus sp.]
MSINTLRFRLRQQGRILSERIGLERTENHPALVREEAGIHVGISPDLRGAASHAASVLHNTYRAWLERDRMAAWGQYKRDHFTIAVGGGNTIKAQYAALIEQYAGRIDWHRHIRFFFLEETSGERGRESPAESLTQNLIEPLARRLVALRGLSALSREMDLGPGADIDSVVNCLTATMVNPIDLREVTALLEQRKRAAARRKAQEVAEQYQRDICNKLGATMQFHYLVSGIGKKGQLGAMEPGLSELRIGEPGAIVLKRPSGALCVALNRGVLTNAERISLLVSGSHKLRALGRFEMSEATDFERTVQETPLRMLRETTEIADRVYIFADETALHFREGRFRYIEQGEVMYNKAETREGEEKRGPHMLLMHGFLGLFSFTSLLVRLPSAWTVSALHRGSHAKTLDEADIFPHYARVLRQAILEIWKSGRAAPVAGHSIAGVIMDHLLLSLLPEPGEQIQPYEQLSRDDRQLVDALRAGGMVSLAGWAPADGPHTGRNIGSLRRHLREQTELDYSGFTKVYERTSDKLALSEEATVRDEDSLRLLGSFLKTPVAKPLIGGLNSAIRSLLNSKSVQQRMLNTDTPYVLRLVGQRLLKTASFYGLFKEVNAALHDPIDYQRRHLQALDIIVAYDIPYLSIVHEDDFLVSSNRHREEYEYLQQQRKQREGVRRAADLDLAPQYIAIKRSGDSVETDPLNPHLLIMATSTEGNRMQRRITAAMTDFVNANLARAIEAGKLKPLSSVERWQAEQPARPAGKARKVA